MSDRRVTLCFRSLQVTSLTAEVNVTKTKQQLCYLKITLQIGLLLNGVLYLLFAEIACRLNFTISYREIFL